MCVNSLNGKTVYKKAAENLAVLEFCRHTILPTLLKERQACRLLLRTIGRNFYCGPLLYFLYSK